jgi:anthranilate synthase component 1
MDCFFFQSSEAIGTKPDMTIIGIGPFEIIRSFRDRVQITFNDHSECSQEPFFQILEERIESIQTSEDKDTKFQNGGVFGCIGYESISEIEPILKKNGHFSSPSNEVLAEVLVARQLLVFDHKIDVLHLISSTPSAIFCSLDDLESILDHVPTAESETLVSEPMTLEPHRLTPVLGEKEYSKRVSLIKEHIKEGDIFQAVLAERIECRTEASELEIFSALRCTSPAPYSFYFRLRESTFFGASPEAFVRVEGRAVTTNPIAGSRPRGSTVKEDKLNEQQLLRSTKESAEHLMLVDLARNDLGRLAKPGSVKVAAFRRVHYFSNIMHLVSEVKALLADGVSALGIFKACFPAGTLSGAPKIRAMEILSQLETVPRGLYGGAVVAFDSKGGLDSCIAIRCLEIKNGTAVLRAGAGIVSDSKAQREYLEILSKTKLLRTAIALAEKKMKLNHVHLEKGGVL